MCLKVKMWAGISLKSSSKTHPIGHRGLLGYILKRRGVKSPKVDESERGQSVSRIIRELVDELSLTQSSAVHVQVVDESGGVQYGWKDRVAFAYVIYRVENGRVGRRQRILTSLQAIDINRSGCRGESDGQMEPIVD